MPAITERRNRFKQSEKKISIEISGSMYSELERLQRKIEDAPDIETVVEIALELILEAEDKEIQFLKDGKTIASYDIWKK